MTRRTLLLAASGLSLVGLLLMGLGEITIRLVHLLRDGIPLLESPSGRVGPIVLDPRLGWRATDWYAQDLTEQTSEGVVYAVHRSQSWHGFRQYGNVRSKKPKLLVILQLPRPRRIGVVQIFVARYHPRQRHGYAQQPAEVGFGLGQPCQSTRGTHISSSVVGRISVHPSLRPCASEQAWSPSLAISRLISAVS